MGIIAKLLYEQGIPELVVIITVVMNERVGRSVEGGGVRREGGSDLMR